MTVAVCRCLMPGPADRARRPQRRYSRSQGARTLARSLDTRSRIAPHPIGQPSGIADFTIRLGSDRTHGDANGSPKTQTAPPPLDGSLFMAPTSSGIRPGNTVTGRHHSGPPSLPTPPGRHRVEPNVSITTGATPERVRKHIEVAADPVGGTRPRPAGLRTLVSGWTSPGQRRRRASREPPGPADPAATHPRSPARPDRHRPRRPVHPGLTLDASHLGPSPDDNSARFLYRTQAGDVGFGRDVEDSVSLVFLGQNPTRQPVRIDEEGVGLGGRDGGLTQDLVQVAVAFTGGVPERAALVSRTRAFGRAAGQVAVDSGRDLCSQRSSGRGWKRVQQCGELGVVQPGRQKGRCHGIAFLAEGRPVQQ
jgi:hypothetical protein